MHIALMKHKLVIMGAIFALLASAIPFSGVFAQENNEEVERIAISPTSKPYDLEAGEIRTDEVTVINDGDLPFDFVMYARPYSVTNEEYTPDFSTTKPNTDVYQWIKFEKTKFSLAPREKATVKYTIKVPQDATPGGHYGVIFAETESKDEAAGASVVRKKRVGSIVYATVKGEYKIEGQTESIEVPFWQSRPPMQVSARVTNTGNTDFAVKNTFVVKDVFGRVKYENSPEKRILPNTTRDITLPWEGSPQFGLFKVDYKIEYLDKATEKSGYVLIAPRWFPILVLAVVAAGVGYAIYTLRKSRR